MDLLYFRRMPAPPDRVGRRNITRQISFKLEMQVGACFLGLHNGLYYITAVIPMPYIHIVKPWPQTPRPNHNQVPTSLGLTLNAGGHPPPHNFSAWRRGPTTKLKDWGYLMRIFHGFFRYLVGEVQYWQLQFGFWLNDLIHLSLGGLVIFFS